MNNAARLLCLLGAAAALAGCVETRFESPLGDNIETCDPHWKGVWADPESSDEPSAIYVDDECHCPDQQANVQRHKGPALTPFPVIADAHNLFPFMVSRHRARSMHASQA